MSKLEDKSVAISITVVLILSSFFIVGGNDLVRMREEVKAKFHEGTPVNPMSIQQQIDIIIGQSSNMMVVSQRYLNEDDELLVQLNTLRLDLIEAETPGEKYIHKNKLIEVVHTIEHMTEALNMSDMDKEYVASIVANIESSRRIIGNNKYNIVAAEFNEKLSRFPANIIGLVRGVELVYIYG